jgi:hypothetical protein
MGRTYRHRLARGSGRITVMQARLLFLAVLALGCSDWAEAQVAQMSRFEILGTLIADNAAARIAMPLGGDGVQLSDDGVIDERKLLDALQEDGRAITVGEIVTITGINFDDDTIEVELNGGGRRRRGILDRIQFSVGGTQVDQPREEVTGSRIVLRFEGKAPADLTPDGLKAYLASVLDFEKQNFMDSGVESLPEEFQEAVRAKEAKVGMDRSTVLMAIGRPDDKVWETVDGVAREDWIYYKRGLGADFITFEGDIVVRIIRH